MRTCLVETVISSGEDVSVLWCKGKKMYHGFRCSSMKERTWALERLAKKSVPDKTDERTGAEYVLESQWAYDHNHSEYFTISLEPIDVGDYYEQLLDPSCNEGKKKRLLNELCEIFHAQVPTHGTHRMVRLYRVVDSLCFVSRAGGDVTAVSLVDIHWTLKPICDFDPKNGKPIPCGGGSAK